MYMQVQVLKKSSNAQYAGQSWQNVVGLLEAKKERSSARLLAELTQKNRELQIEAALEKVRARAFGMHHSFELSDVLSVLFEQYDVLGICPVFSHLSLFDLQNNKFTFRTTGRNGQRVQAEQRIDIDAIDAWKESVENWKKGGPHQVNSHMYPKEILPQVFDLFGEILSAIPAEARFGPEDFPNGVFITQGYCKFGYIGFGHYREATNEEKEVIQRMATEFERLYQRFLDLQSAEAQIKEAQVDASLERVRAAAMAMHSSNDIGNATGVLFRELDKLGISLLRCGFYIVNEVEKTMQVWGATTSANETVGRAAGTVSMTIHPMLEAAYEGWRGKESLLHYTLAGDDITRYYKTLSEHGPQFAKHMTLEKQTGTSFFFAEGALFIFTKDPLDAAVCAVLKKFAVVVGLTYRRYLDLQLAEVQGREVLKQASLDRIRAEIASMRTTADLERITPLFWNELTVLGVPFIRCGVFIMDDLQQAAHTYLSMPDGRAVASFDLPYNCSEGISQIVIQWKKKELFTQFWDEATYAAFADQLVQHGVLPSPERYLRTLPQGGFYLHFVPFLQGMLYVGNTNPFAEDELSLIRCIATAFSTAYARYEDFKKLENAKQQVDKTLLDLKQAQQRLIQAEKMASLGQLTAGIAHEIQNPLNFVNNFSEANKELLTEIKLAVSQKNYDEILLIAGDLEKNEEKILHHGRRADSIVKGMLQHARTNTSRKELTNINKLAEEYLRLCYQGVRAKDKSFVATLETHFDESIPELLVIPGDLGRVFLNLYGNAFYAVQKKMLQLDGVFQPIVSVTTKRWGNNIIITVKDNGDGMSQSVAAKVFEPFFTTKPAGEGTGLGLSLSYDIITNGHGGELNVETKEGVGSEFVVRLPVS